MYETKYQTRSRINESYSTNADYSLSNRLYQSSVENSQRQGGEYKK